MGLTGFSIPRKEIKFTGGSIAVRGLSLNDIVTLVNGHREQLEDMYAELKSSADFDAAARDIGAAAVVKAPRLVADVIALAADEPGAAAEALKLPLDVQILALNAILNLTTSTEGGLKNLLTVVIEMVRQAAGAVKDLRQLPSGFGDSGDTSAS